METESGKGAGDLVSIPAYQAHGITDNPESIQMHLQDTDNML